MSEPPDTAADRLVELADRLRLLVRHLAGRTITARVELDDVVQEVFLRVLATPHERWRDLDDTRLWHYVAQAARNTVVDVARALRAARRRGRELTPGDWSRTAGFEPAAATRGQLTRLQQTEARAALEHAFVRLSAEHRRVLGLRQFAGLSAEETGRRLGRSATAVHSL